MALKIDRYEVQHLLGQGAMGKVYLADDPKLNRKVAIKLLSAGSAADDDLRRRFRLEARAIAALKHPNIVELYDYSGEDAEDLFLVMEYLSGETLDNIIATHGIVPEPTALCLAHELCLALSHAHGNHVIHRDLKPHNIMLYNGRIVLTDFGVVKAIAESSPLGAMAVRTMTQALGTPGFMAPEQFVGKDIDHRVDIFALGVILYFVTTGELPYHGDNVEDVYKRLKAGKFTDPREHQKLLSEQFCAIIERAIRPRPKDRYHDAEQMRRDISALLSSHGVSDVRHELANYQRNPAYFAIEQRERSIEALLKDLKVALKDRNDTQAEATLSWLKTLAPLDQRLTDMSGIEIEGAAGARLTQNFEDTPRIGWWITGSVFIGGLLGFVAGVFVTAERLIPAVMLVWLEQARDWLLAQF